MTGASTSASGGSVIVEDPRTGKILAMGGDPDFDPNNYSSSSLADFVNTNVASQYEPGSIMKVITMAAGIDAGKITPDTTYTDKGKSIGRTEVQPEPDWIVRKLCALACYRSQIAIANCREHFTRGLNEYYA